MTPQYKVPEFQKLLHANPLLPIALSFALGITADYYCDNILISCAAIAIATILFLTKKTIIASWIVSIALGAIVYGINRQQQPSLESGFYAGRFYEAEIENAIEYDNTQSATVKIVSAGSSPDALSECQTIRARLSTPTFNPKLEKGYSICFYGSLNPVTIQTDLPDEWTPQHSILANNILFRAFVEPDSIHSINPTPGIIPFFVRLNNLLQERLYATSLTAQAKEFLAASLLGNSSDMSRESKATFSESGLSHILALSGMHIGLIAMLVSLALWPLKIMGHRKLTSIIIILILWSYCAITGLSPSVTRATTMMTIYICGQMIQRQSSAINSLSAAALIILIFDPTSLFAIGFQLSFAAVLSIIIFADKLNPFSRRHRFAYSCCSYLSISISAMIGTGLLSAVYFHQFPLYFLLSNIIASILLPFILGGGLLIILFSVISHTPEILTVPVSFLCQWLEKAASIISSLPGATIDNIYLSNAVIIAYVAALIATALWIRKKSLTYGFFWALSIIAFVYLLISPLNPDRKPTLYIARTTFRTDFIIDNSTDTLFVITTLPHEPVNVADHAMSHYKDYMGMRNISNIRVIEPSDTIYHGFTYNDNTILWGNHKIAIVSDSKNIPNINRTNYMVVCRGFRGKIENLISTIKTDTLIIGYDLDPRRAVKYIAECEDLKIPYINLRDRSWCLPYRSAQTRF